MIRPSRQLVLTAVHEAGHACLDHHFSHHFGWSIQQVTIQRRGNVLGAVYRAAGGFDLLNVTDQQPYEIQAAGVASIMSAIAGPIAESILLRADEPDRNNADYRRRVKIIAGLANLSDSRLTEWERETRSILMDHWREVEALAATLLEARTIDGLSAHTILATAQPVLGKQMMLPGDWPIAVR
jgi:ATP-dependent Zn protease